MSCSVCHEFHDRDAFSQCTCMCHNEFPEMTVIDYGRIDLP